MKKYTGSGDGPLDMTKSPKSAGANVKETTLKNGGSHKGGKKK